MHACMYRGFRCGSAKNKRLMTERDWLRKSKQIGFPRAKYFCFHSLIWRKRRDTGGDFLYPMWSETTIDRAYGWPPYYVDRIFFSVTTFSDSHETHR